MKKLLSGVLSLAMIVFLWGCAASTSQIVHTESTEQTVSTETTEQTAPTVETTVQMGPAEPTEATTEPKPTTPAPVTEPTPVKEDPYGPIIKALLTGYEDGEIPGYPEMSYMYVYAGDVSEIGYALEDLDGDGQVELLLSAVDGPFPYDAFTVQDGKAVHIFTSGERYSHHMYSDGYIQLHWSNSAGNSGTDHFRYTDGQMVLVERIVYDAWYAEEIGVIQDPTQATADNCYFVSSTTDTKDYQHVSAEEAVQKLQEFNDLHTQLEIQYISITQYDESC